MNNKQLFLAWLRTTSPDIYMQALRKVTGQPRTLGGLDSDLVDSMTAPATMGSFGQDSASDTSLPEITVSGDYTDSTSYTMPALTQYDIAGSDIQSGITQPDWTGLPPGVEAPAPIEAGNPSWTITPAPDTSAGSSGFWTAFTTAVGSTAAAALTASNQSNLIKLNTQRAQAGLPPVNAQGQVVTSGFAPATSAIYRLESAIGGATGGMSPVLLLAGVGLLAFVFLRKR